MTSSDKGSPAWASERCPGEAQINAHDRLETVWRDGGPWHARVEQSW
jgi:hypothetical protein